MSLPQEIASAGSPMPRNDSVDSATMNVPSEIVAITMTGPAALGITCLNRMPSRLMPSERAAVTKSALRTEITELRVMRAIDGHPKITRVIASVVTPRFSRMSGTCMNTIAPRISGSAKMMSMKREMIASIQPPK